ILYSPIIVPGASWSSSATSATVPLPSGVPSAGHLAIVLGQEAPHAVHATHDAADWLICLILNGLSAADPPTLAVYPSGTRTARTGTPYDGLDGARGPLRPRCTHRRGWLPRWRFRRAGRLPRVADQAAGRARPRVLGVRGRCPARRRAHRDRP